MGDKLKKAIKEKDYLRAKRLIMDNPKYLEENVDCVLDMVKVLSEPMCFASEPLSEEKKDELYRTMSDESITKGYTISNSKDIVFQIGSERIDLSDDINNAGCRSIPIECVRERRIIRVFDPAEPGGSRTGSLLMKDGKVVAEANTDLNDIDIEDDGQ